MIINLFYFIFVFMLVFLAVISGNFDWSSKINSLLCIILQVLGLRYYMIIKFLFVLPFLSMKYIYMVMKINSSAIIHRNSYYCKYAQFSILRRSTPKPLLSWREKERGGGGGVLDCVMWAKSWICLLILIFGCYWKKTMSLVGLWQYVDFVKVGRYFNLHFAPNVLQQCIFLRLLSRLGHELAVLECAFGNGQKTFPIKLMLCSFYHKKNGKTW